MGAFTLSAILFITVVIVVTTEAQLPKRLLIPGAIPLSPISDNRPQPYRRVLQQPLQQQPQQFQAAPVRLRRPPIQNAVPAPIRPVVEEPDDDDTGPLSRDEVARLQQIPVPSPPLIRPQQVQQQREVEDEDDEDEPQQVIRQYAAPVQFRPERPLQSVPRPAPQPIRQVQQPIRQPQPQPQRAVARPQQTRQPASQYLDEDNSPRRTRTRKPPVMILRKYRDDNPDGSITWGYENDDGSFKEENIGIDCVTRGKYGYIDPDGNRREYSYETGLKCDSQQEEPLPDDFPPPKASNKPNKRPQGSLQQQPIRLQ